MGLAPSRSPLGVRAGTGLEIDWPPRQIISHRVLECCDEEGDAASPGRNQEGIRVGSTLPSTPAPPAPQCGRAAEHGPIRRTERGLTPQKRPLCTARSSSAGDVRGEEDGPADEAPAGVWKPRPADSGNTTRHLRPRDPGTRPPSPPRSSRSRISPRHRNRSANVRANLLQRQGGVIGEERRSQIESHPWASAGREYDPGLRTKDEYASCRIRRPSPWKQVVGYSPSANRLQLAGGGSPAAIRAPSDPAVHSSPAPC